MASITATPAQIVGEAPEEASRPVSKWDALTQWIVTKTDSWRSWRDDNYSADWDSYERLWRGKWGSQEQSRASERSKIVTPALSEAVENGAAEIEEAVFGRGADFFDLEVDEELFEDEESAPPGAPPMPPMPGTEMPAPEGDPFGGMVPQVLPQVAPRDPLDDIETTRKSLRDDLQRSDFASNCTEVVLHSAVFGTGFAEIVTEEKVVKRPTSDGLSSKEAKFDIPTLRAVSPRNVLVDPNAKRIEDGLGIAVEEEVSVHLLLKARAAGSLEADCQIKASTAELADKLKGDALAKKSYDSDTAHVIRWYGLVPTKLLFPEDNKDEDGRYLTSEEAEDGEYTECIVVIVNKTSCGKAVENPSPRGDRPVVYFPWDTVPGRLHGRGLCEKGANAQKILDTEVRARLDGLALTWAPMMGVDATRVPRGMKFTVEPGKTVFTQGDPETVLRALKFGQLDANHWQNAQALQAMVGQATGSVDATAIANKAGDARSGAMSMAMAPIIKRYKRTLVRFFDLFLMPALDKIVSRSQQSMPARFPAVGLRVKPASTMGIMQREYETSQLTALLSTMQPATPEHRAILMGIVANTSIPNRESVLKMLAGADEREAAMAAQAMTPEAQALQQAAIQLEMAEKQAKIKQIEADTVKTLAEADEVRQSAEVNAMEVATKGLYAIPAEQQAAEFDRRYKLMQLAIADADLQEKREDRKSNERITAAQLMAKSASDREKRLADHITRMQEADIEEYEVEYNEQGRPARLKGKRKAKPQKAQE